jgi:hypothetical protein
VCSGHASAVCTSQPMWWAVLPSCCLLVALCCPASKCTPCLLPPHHPTPQTAPHPNHRGYFGFEQGDTSLRAELYKMREREKREAERRAAIEREELAKLGDTRKKWVVVVKMRAVWGQGLGGVHTHVPPHTAHSAEASLSACSWRIQHHVLCCTLCANKSSQRPAAAPELTAVSRLAVLCHSADADAACVVCCVLCCLTTGWVRRSARRRRRHVRRVTLSRSVPMWAAPWPCWASA